MSSLSIESSANQSEPPVVKSDSFDWEIGKSICQFKISGNNPSKKFKIGTNGILISEGSSPAKKVSELTYKTILEKSCKVYQESVEITKIIIPKNSKAPDGLLPKNEKIFLVYKK